MDSENTPNVVQPTPAPQTPPAQPTQPTQSAPAAPAGKNPLKKFLLVLIMLLLLGAAGFAAFKFFVVQNGDAQKKPVAKKSVVKIAVNPWQASELNANIAKIILEEKMGYAVELVPVSEADQWASLAKGDIHASLEVWPSGHKENIKKYVETDKTVESGGLLGPVGKIGWYIPKYLLTDQPELATWEGFKDPKNVKLFASTTSAKGQFYTGDPTWTQYDSQIIKNLGLNFEVKTLGSEDELLKVVDESYNQKKAIVFYFWTPHWAHAIYDLTAVELPPYSDECYSDLKSGVKCDYPKDELLKVFWSGLKDASPDAYQFLKKFNYTNEDQIRMLAALQQKKQSVEEVSRNWIDNNKAIWQLWLP